jgi:signal transduction histidine kinase
VRWLWPDGLAGRLALLLGLSLVAVQLLTLPFYLRQEADGARELFRGYSVEQMGHIARLLDPLSPAQRRELLPALSSPVLSLESYFELTEAGAPDDLALAGSLSQQLQRNVVVKQIGEEDGLPVILSSRQRIAIWVLLEDGSWLRFATGSESPSMGWVAHMSAQILLVCLLLIVFAIVASRQLTRPIRTFVAAAERLGTDVNSTPIPERGSRELRRVTRVFNTMQERLQRYVDDRTRMLAAISHDLRTSLTRLRLRIEFIEDPQQRARAERDLQQMDAMLVSTLAFARDDAAQEEPISVDLAQLLHSLCDDLVDMGQRAEYEGPESCSAACRPIALQRAVANVLNNAVSYGGSATLALEREEGGWHIRVDDQGPGIPEDRLEEVFEPFSRLDPARNRSTGGSGLGLSIARSVMRSHGGDVSLCNRPGGGLSVSLRLADRIP